MKKGNLKKPIHQKYISRLTRKYVQKYGFWKIIALQQQMLLHAKNNT
jgi:hypothetical protein